MKRNNKKSIIHILSNRKILINKKKNFIIILAIILTTTLFTGVFSICGSLLESIQDNTMRLVGTSAHAGIKGILPEDYKKLSNYSTVSKSSYRVLISYAENEELNKTFTEIDYGQDQDAKWTFCYPEQGNMPNELQEIATSTTVLAALGIPCKLGEQVPLKFKINNMEYEGIFKLSGFWEGNQASKSQQIWVSKEFSDKYVPTPSESYGENSQQNLCGYLLMQIKYKYSTNLELKTEALLENNGYDVNKMSYSVNRGYISVQLDKSFIIPLVIILLVIGIAGYLIIFNIFYINISAEIRQYGLYKIIGMTVKQVKKLILRQVIVLSLIGITIGLLTGTFLGEILLPYLVKMLNSDVSEVQSFNPLIYISSTVVSFFTIYISCNLPCKIATRVSPIESIRYVEINNSNGNKRKRKRRKKKKVNLLLMVKANLTRCKAKVIITVVSLSLSLILLTSAYSITKGFNLDKFLEESIVGDFLIMDSSAEEGASIIQSIKGVNNDVLEYVNTIDGIQCMSKVYCSEMKQELNELGRVNINKILKKYNYILNTEHQDQNIENLKNKGIIPTFIYGLDEYAISKLKVREGKINFRRFMTGDYILISAFADDYSDGLIYKVGDVVNIKLPSGVNKKLEVMAVVDVPESFSFPYGYIMDMSIIIPQDLYLSNSNMASPFRIVLDVDDEYLESAERYLEGLVTNNSDVVFKSKKVYTQEYNSLKNMFLVVGGTTSAILAFIGFMNFINTVITGILARKQKFAMMQAIGMSRAQLKRMLIWEGELYAILTILFSLSIGSVIGMLTVQFIAGEFWFFDYTYSILPIVICFPIMCLIAYIIPIKSYKNICSGSIVEEIRRLE